MMENFRLQFLELSELASQLGQEHYFDPVPRLIISGAPNKEAIVEVASLFYVEKFGGIHFAWVRRNYWLGVPATVLGAVAGATLIKSQPEWATAFTLFASLLTGLNTFLKSQRRIRRKLPPGCRFFP